MYSHEPMYQWNSYHIIDIVNGDTFTVDIINGNLCVLMTNYGAHRYSYIIRREWFLEIITWVVE